MPHARLYYHAVWSVKGRLPLLDEAWRHRVYGVIRKKIGDLGGEVIAIGGTADHVHVLFTLPPRVPLSTAIGQAKGASSHFVNAMLGLPYTFAWQAEYGVFTVSAKDVPRVARYIRGQQQHHREKRLARE